MNSDAAISSRMWILCLAVAGIAPGLARDAWAAEGKNVVTLVMLGDSVTYSSFSPAGRKLPECVEKELNALSGGKREWKVVNAGVNGETAARCLVRAKRVLDAEKPDLVTLSYGLNDAGGLVDKRLGDPEGFGKTLAALAELVSKHPSSPKTILLTATPFDGSRHKWGKQEAYVKAGGQDAYLDRELNGATRALAAEKDIPLCDLHRYFMEDSHPLKYLLPDGVHPTPEGNEFAAPHIARCVWMYYQAAMKKSLAATETERRAQSDLAKIRNRVQTAKPADTKALRDSLRKIWTACPYLPETAVLWDSLNGRARAHP